MCLCMCSCVPVLCEQARSVKSRTESHTVQQTTFIRVCVCESYTVLVTLEWPDFSDFEEHAYFECYIHLVDEIYFFALY